MAVAPIGATENLSPYMSIVHAARGSTLFFETLAQGPERHHIWDASDTSHTVMSSCFLSAIVYRVMLDDMAIGLNGVAFLQ